MQAMGSAGGFCHEARDITTGDPIEMKAECEDPMSETAGVWLAEGCPRTDVSCGWVVTVGGGQVEKLTLAYFPDQVPLAMACQGGSAIGAELCTSAGFAYP